MKIGIITRGISYNFGGLLQAYALQEELEKLGHNCLIIHIKREQLKTNLVTLLKDTFRPLYQKARKILDKKYCLKLKLIKNCSAFVEKYMKVAQSVIARKTLSTLDKYKFDCYIVGSDVVWRPLYSPYLPHYFLDFVKSNKVKRIAYSASFAIGDSSEYTKEMLKICKPLAQKFDAISVREDVGVSLCKEMFDVEATHLIDPTMFFDANYYEKFITDTNNHANDNGIFTYILDNKPSSILIIKKISDLLEINTFGYNSLDNNSPTTSVENWIESFKKASFIITDSFHGTVFSILFKKPFIVIYNKGRGFARLHSLLRMFGLMDRAVESVDEINIDLLKKNINYDLIHIKIKFEREKAEQFLIKNTK